jgi:hypothetical protein
MYYQLYMINPFKAELNSIRHLLALVGARHIVHDSRIGLTPCFCNRVHAFRVIPGRKGDEFPKYLVFVVER